MKKYIGKVKEAYNETHFAGLGDLAESLAQCPGCDRGGGSYDRCPLPDGRGSVKIRDVFRVRWLSFQRYV